MNLPQSHITIKTEKHRYLKVGMRVVLNEDNYLEDALVRYVDFIAGTIDILPYAMKHYTQYEIDNFPLRERKNFKSGKPSPYREIHK